MMEKGEIFEFANHLDVKIGRGFGTETDGKMLKYFQNKIDKEADEKGKSKKESEIVDQANISMIIRVGDDEKVDWRGVERDMDFTKEDVGLFEKLGENKIQILKGDKRWTCISRDLYDKSCKTIRDFYGYTKKKDIQILVSDKKNNPVILYINNFGIMIAPRVESEDED